MKTNNQLRVLITGGDGLLGTYLYKCLLNSEINCLSLGRKELDITSLENIDKILVIYRPNVIVNCAAYTNVERAETDREACFSVNVSGVINLIQKSNEFNCKLVQISTDFVFDGAKESGIYFENEIPNPINYYGLTKYMAENEVINNANNWIIVRTSWLYGKGSNNFVNKILELSKNKTSIIVTDKEVGSPTYASDLAEAIMDLTNSNESGLFHLTNRGAISRYSLAVEIVSILNLGLIVFPGESSNYLVERPLHVELASSKNRFILRSWKLGLRDFFLESEY